MVDQYHDKNPLIGEAVLKDIREMAETLGFFKDCFENFCSGWSNTDSTGLHVGSLHSAFNLFGGSSPVTGQSKIEAYKKAFIL